MSALILHEYAASPFSEKIRALFGYKNLAYCSVEIPVIMPKPDLTALTGGYRKTPVLQRGADIYCDTDLIAQVIEEAQPEPPVLGGPGAATQLAAARWTDREFFRVAAGMNFQPHVVAANPSFQDPKIVEAFLRDRAALTGGFSLALPPALARAGFEAHMESLDEQLSLTIFLGGESPSIADFSTWHCCWFMHRQEPLKKEFAPYGNVLRWLGDMQTFSDAANPTPMNSAEALDLAAGAEPAALGETAVDTGDQASLGDAVQVAATDYGRDPVAGTLVSVDSSRIVIAREDDRTGRLHVHYPRLGFEITPAGKAD